MEHLDIEDVILYRYANDGEWSSAFEKLHEMLKGSKDQKLVGQIEELERNYETTINYYIEGGHDSALPSLYKDMEMKMFRLCSAVLRDKYMRSGMSLYVLNSLGLKSKGGDTEWLDGIEELRLKLAECDTHDETYFGLLDIMFCAIYTSPLLADEDEQTRLTVIIESMDEVGQAYLISALTVGCLKFVCDRKFVVLCHFTSEGFSWEVRARALVGVMLTYNHFWKNLEKFAEAKKSFNNVQRECAELLPTLYDEVVMVCNTKDLREIVEEKLIPLLQKGKEKDAAPINIDGEQSFVIRVDMSEAADKMSSQQGQAILEIMRMMRHGADVNYSSYSNMKRFDFFMSMSHWLMPACAEHPVIKRALNMQDDIDCNGMRIGGNLCSSDVYSMCCMASVTSGAARDKMLTAMSNPLTLAEDMDEEEGKEAFRDFIKQQMGFRRRVRGYLQDWFRLVTLHPAKKEMDDLQLNHSKPNELPFWRNANKDASFLLHTAKFLAEIRQHKYSIEIYKRYLKLSPNDAEALYDLGVCYKEDDQLRMAVKTLRQAIVAGADERQCLRLLYSCHVQLHDYTAVLEDTQRMKDLDDADTPTLMVHSTALMRAGRYEEALEQYRAIELTCTEAELTSEAARGAAWCLFCMRKFDEALQKYDGFIDTGDVHHEDLLNRGHALWALGRVSEAVDSYLSHIRLFVEADEDNKDNPLEIFDKDVPDLMAVVKLTRPQILLMRDHLLMSFGE